MYAVDRINILWYCINMTVAATFLQYPGRELKSKEWWSNVSLKQQQSVPIIFQMSEESNN